jgi:hypothetical protein
MPFSPSTFPASPSYPPASTLLLQGADPHHYAMRRRNVACRDNTAVLAAAWQMSLRGTSLAVKDHEPTIRGLWNLGHIHKSIVCTRIFSLQQTSNLFPGSWEQIRVHEPKWKPFEVLLSHKGREEQIAIAAALSLSSTFLFLFPNHFSLFTATNGLCFLRACRLHFAGETNIIIINLFSDIVRCPTFYDCLKQCLGDSIFR